MSNISTEAREALQMVQAQCSSLEDYLDLVWKQRDPTTASSSSRGWPFQRLSPQPQPNIHHPVLVYCRRLQR